MFKITNSESLFFFLKPHIHSNYATFIFETEDVYLKMCASESMLNHSHFTHFFLLMQYQSLDLPTLIMPLGTKLNLMMCIPSSLSPRLDKLSLTYYFFLKMKSYLSICFYFLILFPLSLAEITGYIK